MSAALRSLQQLARPWLAGVAAQQQGGQQWRGLAAAAAPGLIEIREYTLKPDGVVPYLRLCEVSLGAHARGLPLAAGGRAWVLSRPCVCLSQEYAPVRKELLRECRLDTLHRERGSTVLVRNSACSCTHACRRS
jgi:hypothetical protein